MPFFPPPPLYPFELGLDIPLRVAVPLSTLEPDRRSYLIDLLTVIVVICLARASEAPSGTWKAVQAPARNNHYPFTDIMAW